MRWAVDDFEQVPLELVQHAGDRLFAGVDRFLPIETAGRDEVLGPALLRGDVAAVGRVHDVGENPLRSIEMFGDRRQQNALAAVARWAGLSRSSRGADGERGQRALRGRPRAARDERRDDEHRDRPGGGQTIPPEPLHPPGRFRLWQARANTLPDLQPVLFAALGRVGRLQQLQRADQAPIKRPRTPGTGRHALDLVAPLPASCRCAPAFSFAVVMEDQILF